MDNKINPDNIWLRGVSPRASDGRLSICNGRVKCKMNSISKTRGRPTNVSKEQIITVLTRYKNSIIHCDNNSMEAKDSLIWDEILTALNHKISKSSLYVYACEFRNKLFLKESAQNYTSECDISVESVAEQSFFENDDISVAIIYNRDEFLKLTEKIYYNSQTRKTGKRLLTRFVPGLYQEDISNKLYENTTLPCGFLISNSYISNSLDRGYIKGTYFNFLSLINFLRR